MRLVKKSFMWLCFLAMSLGWSSCEQDTMVRDLPYEDEFEPVYPPSPVTTLLTPADGTAITSGGSTMTVFSWEKSKNPEGSNMIVKYEVLFGPEGFDFKKADDTSSSVQNSDEEATASQLTLSGAFLDLIAEEAGIEPGATGVITWTVRSYCGLDATLGKAIGKITVTRPASNSEE